MNVKPNTQNGEPVDLLSKVVNAKDLPWQKMRFPGCEMKTLLFDPKSGLATMLMKMDPGAVLPEGDWHRTDFETHPIGAGAFRVLRNNDLRATLGAFEGLLELVPSVGLAPEPLGVLTPLVVDIPCAPT